MEEKRTKLRFEELPKVNSVRWLSLEDLPGEEWRDVVGFEGLYMVSDYGRVKSLDRVIARKNGCSQTWKGKILKAKKYNSGYLFVHLSSPKLILYRSIHRIVALAFIANPNNFPQINHKDENRINNNKCNLEWCTSQYNNTYGRHYEKYVDSMIRNGHIRKIYQFTLDGKFVAEYNSIKDATEKTGFTNLSAACKGKYSNVGGSLWSTSSEVNKVQYGRTSKRTVCFLDGKGNIVSEYPSMREAARAHNTSHSQISYWCRTKNPFWKLKY